MQNVRKMRRKRPSRFVRLQYFSTNKVPGETQRSLEDSVLRNASRSEHCQMPGPAHPVPSMMVKYPTLRTPFLLWWSNALPPVHPNNIQKCYLPSFNKHNCFRSIVLHKTGYEMSHSDWKKEKKMVLYCFYRSFMVDKCSFIPKWRSLKPLTLSAVGNDDRMLRSNSIADKCKISPFCAFNDKSMKVDTKLEGIIRNIFSYRAIADLSRDRNGSHLKMTS